MAVETVTVVQTSTDTSTRIEELIAARLVSIPPQLLPPLSSGKRNLQKLYLQDCNLRDAGILTLVQSLQQHRGLLVLNVARNAITNVGACALAAGLPSIMAESGSSLYVYENEIEAEGAKALLQTGQQLQALWAWGNPAAPWAWSKCGDSCDGPHDIVRDLSWWQQRAAKAKTTSPVVVEADAPVAVTEMVHQWQQAPAPSRQRHQRTVSVAAATATQVSPDKNEATVCIQEESDDRQVVCDENGPSVAAPQQHRPTSTPVVEEHNLPSTSPPQQLAENNDDASTKSPQEELTHSVSQTLKRLQMESARRKIRAASVRISPDRKKARISPASSHCVAKDEPRVASPQGEVSPTATQKPDPALRAQPSVVEEPVRRTEDVKTQRPGAKITGTGGSRSLSVRNLILKMNQRKKNGRTLPERKSPLLEQEEACKIASSSKVDVVGRSMNTQSAQSHDIPVTKDAKAAPTSPTMSPRSVIRQRRSPQSNATTTPIAQPSEKVCNSDRTSPPPLEPSTVQLKSILRKSPSTAIAAKKVVLTTPMEESASSDQKPTATSDTVSPCSVVNPPRNETPASPPAKHSSPQNTPSHTGTRGVMSKYTTPNKGSNPIVASEKLVSLDPTVKMTNVSSELYVRLQARLQRIAAAPPPLPVHSPEEVTTKPAVPSSELGKLLARQQQRIDGECETSSLSRPNVAAPVAPKGNAASMRLPSSASSRSTTAPKSPPPKPKHRTTHSLQSPTSPQSELQARLQQRFRAIEKNSIPTMRASSSPRKIVAGHQAAGTSGSLSSFRVRKKLSLGY